MLEIVYVIKEVAVSSLGIIISIGILKMLKIAMEQGMILRRYYLYLVYWWIKWHRKKDRRKRIWLKPLGLCLPCTSFYIALPISIVLMLMFNTYFTLFIVTSYTIIILYE